MEVEPGTSLLSGCPGEVPGRAAALLGHIRKVASFRDLLQGKS